MIGRFEENTIYNEDCYTAIKDIPDKSIDCVYIDIPYLYDNGGAGKSELGLRIKKQSETLLNAGISDGINYEIFDELCRVMKKINIFIWCSKLQLLDIMEYFIKCKGCLFELLVWTKTNPTPAVNGTWLPDIEYCLYFKEKGVKLNDGYELKSKWYNSAINKKDKDKFYHPTIKPEDLVERHLRHTTQPNDLVLDCFIGSGTTAIAAKNTGRRFLGFEINKKYYDIAVNRLNNTDNNGQISLIPM